MSPCFLKRWTELLWSTSSYLNTEVKWHLAWDLGAWPPVSITLLLSLCGCNISAGKISGMESPLTEKLVRGKRSTEPENYPLLVRIKIVEKECWGLFSQPLPVVSVKWKLYPPCPKPLGYGLSFQSAAASDTTKTVELSLSY